MPAPYDRPEEVDVVTEEISRRGVPHEPRAPPGAGCDNPYRENPRPSQILQRRTPGGNLRQEERPVGRVPLDDLAHRAGHLHCEQACGTVFEHMDRPREEYGPCMHISDDDRLPGAVAQPVRSPGEVTRGRVIWRSRPPVTQSPYPAVLYKATPAVNARTRDARPIEERARSPP